MLEIKTLNFNSIEDLAYTRPISLSYFGKETDNINSWKDLYVKIVKFLYEDYKEKIPCGKSFNHGKRIDFGDKENLKSMVEPRMITSELYLETNLSATNIAKKIKSLLFYCFIDESNIVIKYQNKEGVKKRKILQDNNQQQEITHTMIPNNNDMRFELVLAEYFSKGYRIDSRIELRRFKGYWESMFGESIDFNDNTIIHYIKKCGIEYDGKLYMPQFMINEEINHKLFSFINRSFNSGTSVLYYEALFKEFSDDFMSNCMYSPEMLKAYLAYVNKGEFFINKSYMTRDSNTIVDFIEEVEELLIETACPMKNEKIFKKLSHIPPIKIKQVLSANDKFISNGKEEWFHIKSAIIDNEEINNIADIIKFSIQEKRFISGNELIEAISKKYPNVIEQNPNLSQIGMRNVFGYYLKDKFSFKGNIISELGESFSMNDVFADFCKNKSVFTLDELKVLKKELNTVIYFDAVYENSLRISQKDFVSKNLADFQVKKTDETIDSFCTGEYIAIRKITQFGLFPDAGFQWNSYLLEHYVAMFSHSYKLIHLNYNENACVGGIVRKNSDIDTFDELIIDVLATNDLPLNKEDALQYLCDEGFMARRSYSGIEQVLIKARELRNKKGI